MATYPLAVSANGRYLVDSLGVPYFLYGDSPQGLIAQCTVAEATTYFADRQARGMNFMQVHALAGPTFGGTTNFATVDAITPFTTAGDITTPRETYWARLDALITLAGTYGHCVCLTAAEHIDAAILFDSASVAECTAFGQYLGARYNSVDFPNVLWNYGNDYDPTEDATLTAHYQAVCDGVQSQTAQLSTVWLDYLVSASRDFASWNTRIQSDLVYTYYSTYAKCYSEYALTPAKPIHMGEAGYENESNFYNTSPLEIRKQAWWAMTAGASGHVYCNEDIWLFASGWASRLGSFPGLAHCGHLKTCLTAYNWWLLVPDTNTNHAVMTAGYGTYNATQYPTQNYYRTCARASDGSVIVAYIPRYTDGSVTIDMTQITGTQARARWFDPTTGGYAAIGTYDTTGTRAFTPSGNNAAGSPDWVLVLDSTANPPIGTPVLSVR